MRRLYSLFLTVLVLAAFPAVAQESPSIAVVDVAKILSEAKAAKDIQGKLKKHQEAFVSDLSAKEKELRDLEKEIIANKSKWSAEEMAKKRQEFDSKHEKARKKAQEERKKIDMAASKANGLLIKNLSAIVQSIAEEKGYNVVLSSQAVLFNAKEMNITESVLEKLNEEVSSIDVDIE